MSAVCLHRGKMVPIPVLVVNCGLPRWPTTSRSGIISPWWRQPPELVFEPVSKPPTLALSGVSPKALFIEDK
eukprot:3104324-Pyramimonas_sp.AAC.1